MYTLDIRTLKKTQRAYLIIAAVCLVCSIIYELFSHGVISVYMLGAFAIPLLGGAIPDTIIIMNSHRRLHSTWAYRMHNSGIACLTTGCYIKGALDIYGTSNALVSIYLYVGIILLIIAIILAVKR